MSHTAIFVDYFERQFWGNRTGSSGPNSDPALTPMLRKHLAALFQSRQIRSLLDAGCGDANLFKALLQEGAIDPEIQYRGYDCVPGLIEKNRSIFSSQYPKFSATFEVSDVVTANFPTVDLILSRDVLHYLPNALIASFLERCLASGSTYLLVTHNLYSEQSANDVTEVGKFRPVNLTLPPFSWTTPEEIVEEDVFGKSLALFRLSEEKIR